MTIDQNDFEPAGIAGLVECSTYLTQSLYPEFHYILDKLIMNFEDVIQFDFLLSSVGSALYLLYLF